MMALLMSFGIEKGNEVLVQAFTCVAVPNSVLWTGAKPVYVDIDRTFNMDPVDAAKKITPKTKAIIIQHTFGIPADLDALMKLAKAHHLIIIEDCAHSLGATYYGQKIGTFGDAAFFSFGRDKVISSVFGGMAIISGKRKAESGKLKQFQQKLKYPSYFWIFQQLLHPIAFSIIQPLYNFGVGKLFLFVLQRLHLLSFPVYREEKYGMKPRMFPTKYPNALASLLTHQLTKLESLNDHRRKIASYYEKELGAFSIDDRTKGAIYLRFPLEVDDPHELTKRVKLRGILLGNWYHNVIDPGGVSFKDVGYTVGSCPHAEYCAKRIVNLPTNIPLDYARRVAVCLKRSFSYV